MVTILLSHERAGSHLVGELLASFAGVSSIEEVCNANAVPAGRAESFHRFRLDWWLSHPDTALDPSFERSLEFGRAFFAYLASLRDPDNIVVDIKYGHLHNFEEYWKPIFCRPLFFSLCDEIPMNVLHLYRRNVVEAAVSAHVAEIRRIWHSYESGAAEATQQRHTIDVARVIQDALLLTQQTKWIRERWLDKVGSFELQYEEVVRVLREDQGGFDELATFVGGVRTGPFMPTLKKLGRPLRDSIENFDDLARACHEAGLAEFV